MKIIGEVKETDLAWAAGIIDGEGCISIDKNRPSAGNRLRNVNYKLNLRLNMVHKPTIEKLHNMFNVGFIQCITKRKYARTRREQWGWSVTGDRATWVLEMILPYLYTKKTQALLAIGFQETMRIKYNRSRGIPSELIDIRESFYQAIKIDKRAEWPQLEQINQ